MTSAAAPRQYTYCDLLEIDDEHQYEILDGELVMNPAPTPGSNCSSAISMAS